MRTTLDIPDSMYRRIKARTAQEGSTVRGITQILCSQWLDGGSSPKPPVAKPVRKRPAWFGSVKVDADLPHDMASVRRSVAALTGISEDDSIAFGEGFDSVVSLPNLAKANPGFLDRVLAADYCSRGQITISCEKSFRRLTDAEVVA